MRSVLVIDDLRLFDRQKMGLEPNDRLTHARTSAQGLALLETQAWDELWLDYDLGAGDDANRILNYLEQRFYEERPVALGVIFVHSDNPVGAQRLALTLARYYPVVRRSATPYLSAASGK
jgi:hypothetical protein